MPFASGPFELSRKHQRPDCAETSLELHAFADRGPSTSSRRIARGAARPPARRVGPLVWLRPSDPHSQWSVTPLEPVGARLAGSTGSDVSAGPARNISINATTCCDTSVQDSHQSNPGCRARFPRGGPAQAQEPFIEASEGLKGQSRRFGLEGWRRRGDFAGPGSLARPRGLGSAVRFRTWSTSTPSPTRCRVQGMRHTGHVASRIPSHRSNAPLRAPRCEGKRRS